MSGAPGSEADRWLAFDRGRALRVGLSGLLVAAVAAGVGRGLETVRLGRTDRETADRVRREVERRVSRVLDEAQEIAAALASSRDALMGSEVDGDGTRRLFDRIAAILADHRAEEFAATLYAASGVALAWGGRPSEFPPERVTGPRTVFAFAAPLGLRLVRVEPVTVSGPGDRSARRVGTIVVEGVLASVAGGVPLGGDTFVLHTSLADVWLRPVGSPASGRARAPTFVVGRTGSEPLVEVSLPPERIVALRLAGRRSVTGVTGLVLAVTLLLLVGPVLDARLAAFTGRGYAAWSAGAVALVVAARGLMYASAAPAWMTQTAFAEGIDASGVRGVLWRSSGDLALTGLASCGILAILAPAVGRIRLALRRRRRPRRACGWLPQLVAGILTAGLLVTHESLLRQIVDATRVDTLRFSLHPWDATRLALIGGLVFLNAAVLWTGALVLVAVSACLAPWRRAHRRRLLCVWGLPAVGAAVAAPLAGVDVSRAAVLLSAGAVAIAAAAAPRAMAWYRHATQASRLLALFATLLVPAAALYPGIVHHTDAAKRRLVEREFAVQPAVHPAELQARLARSLQQIDAVLTPADFMVTASPAAAPPTEPAFRLWSRTALADARLTSAVELYGPDGRLLSRFALNLPEYAALAQPYEAHACRWEVFGEAVPFGSEERRVLHAERRVCDPAGRAHGSLVVHVMLDYRALPFLAGQAPYQQVFRPTPRPAVETTRAADVELVIYGWGRLPLYTSGSDAWPIDEALFTRLYDPARRPFWTDLRKGGVLYHVHFSNDRNGIYAIGYPALTPTDHLERLGEMVTFAGLAYVVVLTGAAAFGRVARERARGGTRLLREIRASFYRKLFLAFVLASVIPVVTLAFVVREYFAAKLRTDAEAEAIRTAAVARRVIEEFAALQRGAGPPAPPTDDVMVLISQLVDQDAHIFDGPRLLATSERDLFASGLLPQRTPAEVYRAILIDRRPNYVGEDRLGSVRYLMAATPVRVGDRPAALVVPLALRQREIEKEIDELNRGIHLAALLFILLGAAIGLSMAERIADPVRRLTRATRRIARGDFDARILVRSSDELQRLVDAFNTMAAELKAQAAQLERTHRLEAWAEMARQVAHEIKNPLTPIQLSAEHLRRVHRDRGEPLGRVLDGCVESILRQVELLRQIAAEFSAFAASPSPRFAPVQVRELVEDVLEPYRTGVGDRIHLEVEVPGDLPRVHADRRLVARALVNIVENALHAMPGQGVLRVAATAEGSGVRLAITDSGVGMDPDALARVFEPYFSTKASGTGLGLTIAKRNIEVHGGTIAVDSVKGHGTTVTVWLPGVPLDAG